MLTLEIRILTDGKELSIDSVVRAIADELRKSVHDEISVAPSTHESPNSAPAPSPTESAPQAVSVIEAARFLSVSPYTLRRQIASKAVRSIRVGRRLWSRWRALTRS